LNTASPPLPQNAITVFVVTGIVIIAIYRDYRRYRAHLGAQ